MKNDTSIINIINEVNQAIEKYGRDKAAQGVKTVIFRLEESEDKDLAWSLRRMRANGQLPGEPESKDFLNGDLVDSCNGYQGVVLESNQDNVIVRWNGQPLYSVSVKPSEIKLVHEAKSVKKASSYNILSGLMNKSNFVYDEAKKELLASGFSESLIEHLSEGLKSDKSQFILEEIRCNGFTDTNVESTLRRFRVIKNERAFVYTCDGEEIKAESLEELCEAISNSIQDPVSENFKMTENGFITGNGVHVLNKHITVIENGSCRNLNTFELSKVNENLRAVSDWKKSIQNESLKEDSVESVGLSASIQNIKETAYEVLFEDFSNALSLTLGNETAKIMIESALEDGRAEKFLETISDSEFKPSQIRGIASELHEAAEAGYAKKVGKIRVGPETLGSFVSAVGKVSGDEGYQDKIAARAAKKLKAPTSMQNLKVKTISRAVKDAEDTATVAGDKGTIESLVQILIRARSAAKSATATSGAGQSRFLGMVANELSRMYAILADQSGKSWNPLTFTNESLSFKEKQIFHENYALFESSDPKRKTLKVKFLRSSASRKKAGESDADNVNLETLITYLSQCILRAQDITRSVPGREDMVRFAKVFRNFLAFLVDNSEEPWNSMSVTNLGESHQTDLNERYVKEFPQKNKNNPPSATGTPVHVGDKVMLSNEFLNATVKAGYSPFASGVVKKIDPLGKNFVADIEWETNTKEVPTGKVLTTNLVLRGKTHLELTEEITESKELNGTEDLEPNEKMALEVGNDRKLLLKRLNSAKSVLYPETAKEFKNAKLDFEKKRLVGDNGYYLQWKVRRDPSSPITYSNQQTSRGSVKLHWDDNGENSTKLESIEEIAESPIDDSKKKTNLNQEM